MFHICHNPGYWFAAGLQSVRSQAVRYAQVAVSQTLVLPRPSEFASLSETLLGDI